MNFLKSNMIETLAPETYVMMVKQTANWANSGIMMLTQQIMNKKKIKQKSNPFEEQTTIDSNLDERDNRVLSGFGNGSKTDQEQVAEMIQRADIIASIRKQCYEIAEEHDWRDYDIPMDYTQYVESRLTALRGKEVTEKDIQDEMKNSLGITREEAVTWLNESRKEQIKAFESMKDNLIAEATYDDDIDIEEAFDSLSKIDAIGMRVKIINGIMYEVKRIHELRKRYSYGALSVDLSTRRHLLLTDVLTLEDEMKAFIKENKAAIEKELDEKEYLSDLPKILPEHLRTMTMARRQLAAEREIELQAAKERLAAKELAEQQKAA